MNLNMNLADIQIKTVEGNGVESKRESLVLGLQAVADAAGASLDYDDVAAVLGIGCMTVAADTDCIGRWSAFGRDAFLIDAAGLFGFVFRDFHPVDAAVGLDESEEFPIHFQDSYVPLIRRDLENGHPVLAWMGWPDAAADCWGVITGYDEGNCRCTGTTLDAEAAPVPLVGPSYQLYVLERFEPTAPDAVDLRSAFLRNTAAVLANEILPRMDVVTGPEAYDPWRRRLSDSSDCKTCGEKSWVCHCRHAQAVTDARRSSLRFIEKLDDPKLAPAVLLLQQQCELLVSFCNRNAIQQALTQKKARADLADRIGQVKELEKRLESLIRSISAL